MNIVVLLKVVPDVVEELDVAPSGTALDTEFLRMVPSESDDHSVEQALLLKERYGGTVNIVALDAPEVDQALFHALARGADRVLKISGASEGCRTSEAAAVFAEVIRSTPELNGADLILTGVQAIDDLDGLLGPLVALHLGLPFLGIVVSVALNDSGRRGTVLREYPGGVHGEFEVDLPAVLGIQAAEKPPRYVPVAKVRAAMKTQQIEETDAPKVADGSALSVARMRKPQPVAHAEMIDGPLGQASTRLAGILGERGLV